MAAVRLSSPGLCPFLAQVKKVSPPPSSAALQPERVRRRSPSALRSPLRPRWSRSSKPARRNDMAIIGSFKKSGQEFQGEIVTLSLKAKGVRIVPETERTNDNAPSHRVYVGGAEVGAVWPKRSGEAAIISRSRSTIRASTLR